MTSEYRNICDICVKETKGFCDSKVTDRELAMNNWDIRIDAHWLDSVEDSDLLSMEKETEVNLDACLECAMGASKILKKWIEQKKNGIEDVSSTK